MKTLVEVAQRIMDLKAELVKYKKEKKQNQAKFGYGYIPPSFDTNEDIAEKQSELQELTQILSNQAFENVTIFPVMAKDDDSERGKYNALRWFLDE